MALWLCWRGGAAREVCASLGARQVFIKPHCPWQNGKVERLNRTLATEWAYHQVFTTNTDRANALAPLARALQHSTTPQCIRRPPTHQPPETNVMAGYT
jgi:transposase InsO family protein